MTSSAPRRATAFVAALAVSVPLLASLATAPASPSAPRSAPPGVGAVASRASAPRADLPRIRWRDCGRRIDCGRIDAPLDYDKPDGATVGLILMRVPARKQARRIGAIFVNPGGPGGPAADFAPYAASQMFDRKIRNRFDVIGIDPRGVGGSQRADVPRAQRRLVPARSPSPTPASQIRVTGWPSTPPSSACAPRSGSSTT